MSLVAIVSYTWRQTPLHITCHYYFCIAAVLVLLLRLMLFFVVVLAIGGGARAFRVMRGFTQSGTTATLNASAVGTRVGGQGANTRLVGDSSRLAASTERAFAPDPRQDVRAETTLGSVRLATHHVQVTINILA
jgi:hypothetical protein